MTAEKIDFTGVAPAEGNALGGSKFLKPGMYWLTPVEATYLTSSKKGTPGMEVTFKCSSKNDAYNEKIAKCKFWLSANTMPRINYLHQSFYGKLIEKKFNSWEELVKYFQAIFESEQGKKIKKPTVVAGSLSDDGTKIYSDMPYSGYLVAEQDFEEGEFAINGELFKSVMTSKTKIYNPDKPNSNEDFIPKSESSTPWNTPPTKDVEEDNEEYKPSSEMSVNDLPF